MRENNYPALKNKPETPKKRKSPAEKKPKRITESYLHNSGLYYLQRFAASSAHFKKVMMQKVKKSCLFHTDQDFEKCASMVDELIQKFIRAGLLDDEVFTRTKINSLRQKGKSKRIILTTMQAKGIQNDQAQNALEEYDLLSHNNFNEAEYEAAMIFARKKKLGPFRTEENFDNQKELGKFARAGFSYEISAQIINKSHDDF